MLDDTDAYDKDKTRSRLNKLIKSTTVQLSPCNRNILRVVEPNVHER
jgi:hypothetical protein